MPRIAFVADPARARILDQAAERLRAAGYEVAQFASAAALAADPAVRTIEVLAAAATIPDMLFDAAPRVRAVVSPWTGIDMYDLAGLRARGIAVANGQLRQNYVSMAEATIMLMLVASYDLEGTRASLDAATPPRGLPKARMLSGRTVGLVGFGKIGVAVAERLAGWEVRILTWLRRDKPLPTGVQQVLLDRLIEESDVVSVHVASTPDTHHLLDERRLRLMKHGAVLINTARGAIIDEAALARVALERPDLRFALDTFETEPLPRDSPLRALPQALLTPHRAGHTPDTIAALPDALVDNVLRLLAGREAAYPVA